MSLFQKYLTDIITSTFALWSSQINTYILLVG